MQQLPDTTDDRLAKLEETVAFNDAVTANCIKEMAVFLQKLTALAEMHDQLEGRVEALEAELARLQAYLPQDKQQASACAVDVADVGDDEEKAIAAIMGAANAAAQGVPEGMIVKDI